MEDQEADQNATRGAGYTATLKAMRRSFLEAGLYSVGINLLMLVGPLYMLQIYDRVMLSGSIPTLMGLFAIVVVLYVFMGVYDAMRARVLSRVAYRMDSALAPEAFARRFERDETLGNALRDVTIMRRFLAGPAVRALFDAPWMPIFLLAVFLIHPMLGALTLAGMVAITALALINHRLTKAPTAEASAHERQERDFIEQGRRGMETVQGLGMVSALAGRWRRMHDTALFHGQESGDRGDVLSSLSRAFRMLLQALLLTAGAYLALQQEISMGMIIGVSILAGRALAPVDTIIAQWRTIAGAWETHESLKQAFDAPEAAPRKVALPAITGRIEVKDVAKKAPHVVSDRQPRILEDVSFALDPGDGLCVMGSSASGKSSLARLLVGAWMPDAGQVRIDGATLDQWPKDALGCQIGYLPQKVELFPGTVAENISRFDPEARDEDIVAAAERARIHDMVLGLPEGYATVLGSGAAQLSGGQAQRVGLARALYGAPKFVVLDEPNANLDLSGDDALVDTVKALRTAGATVVMMTHRPSLIAAASKVLVMHKGRVILFGDRELVMQDLGQAPASKDRAEAPSSESNPASNPGETPLGKATRLKRGRFLRQVASNPGKPKPPNAPPPDVLSPAAIKRRANS